MTDLSLTCRRIIPASAERIYKAWLDPMVMVKYMAPGPDMHVREARADARVGGRFFVMMVGDKDLPHEGSYKVLVPFSRIVFTWETPWSAPGTEVDVRLTPVEGGTEVVLTQVRFLSEGSRDGHEKGWSSILDKLAEVLRAEG